MKGIISMSDKEVDRMGVMQRLEAKEIRQRHAAKLLQVSVRQVKRLVKKYRAQGAAGLVHKGRGRKGNRALPQGQKARMLTLIKTNYADFGPTFACEKLAELHDIHHADETVRKLMINAGLWIAKERDIVPLHQLRDRRECLGELVQVDGSPHDWFEGRAGKCTLLVFIDDATGKLLHLEFVKSESTQAYFVAVWHYLENHGRPVTFYTDRHGVFRVNTTKGQSAATSDSNGLTQFGRAMQELDIATIFAQSAQAKGRVERVNQTLQDRLVKEMRLRGINSWEEGNAYLPAFMEAFNKKFSVVAKSPIDMHRPLLSTQNPDAILCEKYTRILSKHLSISYENRIYQIQTERPSYALRNARVTVEKRTAGEIRIVYNGQSLAYTILTQQPKAEIVDSKHVNATVDLLSARIGIPIVLTEKVYHKPAADHPWRNYRQAIN